MNLPLDTVGNVLNSDHAGHKIKILDDSESTGGYLIYEWWDNSNGPNQSHSFDSWVENLSAVESFLKEKAYIVVWPT